MFGFMAMCELVDNCSLALEKEKNPHTCTCTEYSE
jgi:hypothetical protein